MTSTRALARLLRFRERSRDLAAARASHAEADHARAGERRVAAQIAQVALDDGLEVRVAGAADRALDLFARERTTLTAEVAATITAATVAARDAQAARDAVNARERAVRSIERAMERARDRRVRAEARHDQLAHDDLASRRPR